MKIEFTNIGCDYWGVANFIINQEIKKLDLDERIYDYIKEQVFPHKGVPVPAVYQTLFKEKKYVRYGEPGYYLCFLSHIATIKDLYVREDKLFMEEVPIKVKGALKSYFENI